MNERFEEALRIATEAAEIALKRVGQKLDIQSKGDQGEVTNIDLELNTFIVDALRKSFNNDLVISEEEATSAEPSNRDFTWFVDPIDGTRELIKGTDGWSVMIGCISKGKAPSLGIVVQPTLGKTYSALENKAWVQSKNEERREMKLSSRSEKEWIMVHSRSHPESRSIKVQSELNLKNGYQHGSVGLKMGQIAEERADLYCNFSGRCHLWDTCAGEAIIRAVGGVVLTDENQPISYDRMDENINHAFLAGHPQAQTIAVPILHRLWEGGPKGPKR